MTYKFHVYLREQQGGEIIALHGHRVRRGLLYVRIKGDDLVTRVPRRNVAAIVRSNGAL